MIPTGFPLWTRAAGFGNYGGHVNKRNHLNQGVVDPETDVSAEQGSRLATDLASIARTAPFAVLRVTCNDTGAAAPTVEFISMSTGVHTTGYDGDAAPTGFPSAARVSDGRFTLTFGSSYLDDYGVSGVFVVQPGSGTIVGSTAGGVSIARNSDTVLEVRAMTTGGAALANATVSLTVYSGGA